MSQSDGEQTESDSDGEQSEPDNEQDMTIIERINSIEKKPIDKKKSIDEKLRGVLTVTRDKIHNLFVCNEVVDNKCAKEEKVVEEKKKGKVEAEVKKKAKVVDPPLLVIFKKKESTTESTEEQAKNDAADTLVESIQVVKNLNPP